MLMGKMKNVVLFAMIGLMGTALITGCGNRGASSDGNRYGENAEVDSEKVNLQELDTGSMVKLGSYKSYTLDVPKYEVTDEYLQSYIDNLLAMTAEYEIVPEGEPVALGDIVNIDYVGKKDDVPFDGGTAQGFDLTLGSGQFIDGFEDGLVGVKNGESKNLNLKFPENYWNEDMAGAEVVFEVKINSATRYIPQEMNDAFVVSQGIEGVSTVEQFKKHAREELTEQLGILYERGLDNAVTNALMESSVVNETPVWLIDKYFEKAVNHMKKGAETEGVSYEEYIMNHYGTDDVEGFEENLRVSAKDAANQFIVIKAVADKEGITASEEDVTALINEWMSETEYASEQEMLDDISRDREDMYVSALSRKVSDLIISTSTVIDSTKDAAE